MIGNSSYENTAALKNPKNDAADITALLRKLGFEVVEGLDLDKRKMERAIRDFGVKLAGADLALFFYAGHGLQVNGKNYMVPTDARLAVEGDVDFEVLELTLVLKQMEREATTRVLLLDACRDNPLTRSLRSSMTASRSGQLGQGLAKLDRTQVGTLIGYSTEPGSVASDGDGRNSPYTKALLAHLDTAGKDLSSILSRVRGEVVKATAGQQVPWESTSLLGPVYLKQEAPKPAEAAPKPEAKPDTSVEVAFWNTVKESKVALELQIYLDRFPTGAYADLARLRLEQLHAAAKAEETRKAEEARKAEETRKVEETRRAEEAQKAAVAVKAAEMRKAEEARKATEAVKVANLPAKAEAAKPTELAAKDTLALTRALQAELKRVGCDPGATDGEWGAKAKKALGEFVRLSKAAVPTAEPSDEALRALSEQKGRICPLRCGAREVVKDGVCVALPATAKTVDRVKPKASKQPKASDDAVAKDSGGGWKSDAFCSGNPNCAGR